MIARISLNYTKLTDTDMDYKERYEKALERARSMAVMPTDKAMLEEIFPELRESESEDERIRKEIVGVIQKHYPNTPESYRWISWLEKQKEPHYTKRNALFDKCVAECDPAVMKEVSDEIDEMLQKEQKPQGVYVDCTEHPEWYGMLPKEQKPAESSTNLDELMDDYFANFKVPEHQIIFEDTYRKIATDFYEMGRNHTEEPVDLENAVEEYFEGTWPGMETPEQCNTHLQFTPPAIMRLARYFAQWGAEHRGSSEIPNDLEEAAKNYALNTAEDSEQYSARYLGYKDGAKWQKEQTEKRWLEDRDGCFWDGVEEGKKAMKEQMLKEAVEGTIVDAGFDDNTALVSIPDKRYDEGDKVRIIICKKED